MFRWFVGLSVYEPVSNPSTFSKNRDRLAQAEVGRRLIEKIVEMARRCNLTSNEYFSVDGTLIEAWASQNSLRCKDGSDNDDSDGVGRNTGRNFQGEQRSNQTHASRTDSEAMLATKSRGMATRPSYTSHTLTKNHNGLLVDAELTLATETAERDTAIDMGTMGLG